MDDDEVFDRGMASLGVEPLNGSTPGRLAAERDRSRDESDRQLFGQRVAERDRQREEEDQRLFKRAMRELEAPAGGAKAERHAPARPERPKVRRLKTRPKNLRVDDQIDLHGLRTEAALRRLEHFVAQAASSGLRTVLVITGKGHHSPGGRGILRHKVEDWIRERGWRRVRTWSEAPARLGGRGAFVLYLRASAD